MSVKTIVQDRIRQLMVDRPGITQKQIMQETGLSKNYVAAHVKDIRAEWEAKP